MKVWPLILVSLTVSACATGMNSNLLYPYGDIQI